MDCFAGARHDELQTLHLAVRNGRRRERSDIQDVCFAISTGHHFAHPGYKYCTSGGMALWRPGLQSQIETRFAAIQCRSRLHVPGRDVVEYDKGGGGFHVCDRRRPWLDEQMDLRDYLRAHPEERDRYADLKKRLAEEIDQSFLQYTISKMSMSIEMIDRAREWRTAWASA